MSQGPLEQLSSPQGASWEQVQRIPPHLLDSLDGPFLIQLTRKLELPAFAAEALESRLQALATAMAPQARIVSLAPRTGDEPVVIGRSTRLSDVVLDANVISKRHAEIYRPTARYRLKDLESANGTFLEGRRLPAGVPVVVESGQSLTLGEGASVFLAPEHLRSLVGLARRRTTGRRRTTRLGLPPAGMPYSQLERRAALKPLTTFVSELGGPFLLELRPGLLDEPPPLEAGVGARLELLQRRRHLGKATVHALTPPGEGVPTTVGRKGAQAELDSTDTSRRHAELRVTGTGWRLVDLESTNGTWVEGRRLAVGVPTRITSGQVVRFGEYRTLLLAADHLHGMLYRGEAQPERDAQKVAQLSELLATPPEGIALRELVERISHFKREPFLEHCVACFLVQVPVDHTLPSEAPEDDLDGTQSLSQSRILSLERSKKIRDAKVHVVLPQPDDAPLRLGRDATCSELVLGEPSVSKAHAELQRTPTGWQLVDLASGNGTYLEGERLPPGVLFSLKGGQSLSFSSYLALWLTPPMAYQLGEQVREKRRSKRL